MQKITPNLWFDSQAEEAAKFYASVFPSSRVGLITRYGEAASKVSGQPAGSVMTVEFTLDGQEFLGLNGGPMFKITEAVSFIVNCDTQEEIDYYWSKLTDGGGEEGPCGWLKDRFGLSWQVAPAIMNEMMRDPDETKKNRMMAAMLTMKKLDIGELKRAFEDPV